MVKQTPTSVVHFYRATVMHADLWRRRLDVTTNWSVVTTAGIITFAFSEVNHPHISILIAFPFTWLFILMESRRYQMYDMWRHRVRLLNRFVIAPALSSQQIRQDRIDLELDHLAHQLGTSIPRLQLRDAVGYRIRRNYGLIFGAIFTMWLLKLFAHPKAGGSVAEILHRGHIGSVPGWVVFFLVLGLCMYAFYLGARAPTERMRDWIQLPSPLERFLKPNMPGRELTLCDRELALESALPPPSMFDADREQALLEREEKEEKSMPKED